VTNLGLEEGIAEVVKQSVALIVLLCCNGGNKCILESCLLRAVCDRFLLCIFFVSSILSPLHLNIHGASRNFVLHMLRT
jgi:hypothetical protein